MKQGMKPETRKEMGRWLMDVAKYTLTAAIVMSFLGEFGQKWMFYGTGLFIVTLCFFYGLNLFNKD